MPNPFFFAGKITNPELFIGREKELRKIFGYLDTTHTGQIQHVSVVGARRIGKSSLLYHISQNPQKYLSQTVKLRFVYIDLDSPHFHTLNGFIQHTLSLLELTTLKKPTLEDFYERIENLNGKKKVWTVFLMDEFEHLTQRNMEFKDSFFESLRSLGNNNLAGIITASQKPLKDLARQGKLTSPFFNIFHQIDLGEFTDSETKTLLGRGNFTQEECREIIKIAENHPARLQIVGSLLYEAKTDKEVVNWKQIRKDAYKEPPFVEHVEKQETRRNWLVRAFLWLVWDMPAYIGHTIMVFIGRGAHTNETSDRMMGYLAILVVLGLIFGIIQWSLVTKAVRRLSDFFFE